MNSTSAKRIASWSAVTCLGILVLTVTGCMTDKSANSDTPMEAARYSAIDSHLERAFGQFCDAFDDALAARFETDTAEIPGIAWPFEMPSAHRSYPTNFVDTNVSWGVGYNLTIDTINYFAFWKLGRFVDTGVLVHGSSIPASRIWHNLQYGHSQGSGKSAITWSGTLDVSMQSLDQATAQVSASFVGSHKIGEACGTLPCETVEIEITSGEFGKEGDEFDLSTLSGNITGSLKFTEFYIILGHEAIYTWELSGTVANGMATVTATSGHFSATGTYSLCP